MDKVSERDSLFSLRFHLKVVLIMGERNTGKMFVTGVELVEINRVNDSSIQTAPLLVQINEQFCQRTGF